MQNHNRFSVLNSNSSNIEQSNNSILDTTKWRNIDNNKYKNFSSFNKRKQTLQNLNKEIQNRKTLLCNNMITKKYCDYGSNCKFAHSLDEQYIDKSRKLVHDILILNNNKDLSHINFQENVSLYRAFLGLTKLCDKENCAGGYNCKYGACGDSRFHVCLRDLNYGDCPNGNSCQCVHLTKRNLVPFYSGSVKLSQQPIQTIGDIQGTLLTENFFDGLKSQEEDDEVISNLSVSTDSRKTDVSDEYEQSIFVEVKKVDDDLCD